MNEEEKNEMKMPQKTPILALLVVPLLAFGQPAPAPEAQADPGPAPDVPSVERIHEAYGFDRDSTWDRLLAALRKADAEIVTGEGVERAHAAIELAVSYVKPDQELRLQLDFGLHREPIEHKVIAARRIAELIREGQPVDETLGTRIADRLCLELEKIDQRSNANNHFVSAATDVLIALMDPRGLDIVLSDTTLIGNLKIKDDWSEDSSPEIFEELARRFMRDTSNPGNLSRASLYWLMAQRRRENGRVEPIHEVFDMARYKGMSGHAESPSEP